MAKKVWKNKKKLSLTILGILFLTFGFWANGARETKAADYKFLEVYLDVDSSLCTVCGAGDCNYLEGFHGINSFPHSHTDSLTWTETLNLPAAPTPETGYNCGIWVTEDGLVDNFSHILWTKKGKKLSKSGTDIIGDLGMLNTDWRWCNSCTNSSTQGDCTIYDGGALSIAQIECDSNLSDNVGADKIINYNYNNAMDCAEPTQPSDPNSYALAVDGASNSYKPKYDILCAGTNSWKTCEANSCASVVTANDWACDGTTKVWTDCTALGKTCVAGACVASSCPVGDFTCQNECTPVNNHRCNGAQLQECITTCDADTFLDWCNTATAGSEAGLCADGFNNDCDGNTDGADPDCPSATCTVWVGDPVYRLGQMIEMFYKGVTCGTGTLELTDSASASKKFSDPPPACSGVTNKGFMSYTTVPADAVGTWTVTLDSATDVGGNPCATMTATTKVVECFNNSNCINPLKPVCDATGTCVIGGGCVPTGAEAGNCSDTVDNDCANGADCADPACAANPACCTANGGACPGGNSDCCSSNCVANTCAAVPTCATGNGCVIGCVPVDLDCTGCTANGGACTINSNCCFNNCVGGFCVAAAIPVCDPTAWLYCNPLKGTIDNIVQAGETLLGYILGLIGSIALLVIIIAGAIYMTSAGSEEKISTSKRILTGAVIGLIIALLAYSLLQVIISIL